MFIVHFLFVFLSIYQIPQIRTSRAPSSNSDVMTVELDSSGRSLHPKVKDANVTNFTGPTSVAAFANVTLAAEERISSQSIEGNVSSVSETPQSTTQGQANIFSGLRTRLGLFKVNGALDPLLTVRVILIAMMFSAGLWVLHDYMLPG